LTERYFYGTISSIDTKRTLLKLKDIATIRTGLVLSRKKATPHENPSYLYPLMTLKCFTSTSMIMSECVGTFSATEQIENQYMSRARDVVVRLRAPNQAVYVDPSNEGLLLSSLMAVIRIKDNLVDPHFLTHYLNSEMVRKLLHRELKGTTIPMIKTKDLETLPLVLPPIQEQRKVVALMELAYRESTLLEKLRVEKLQLSQEILDTVIQQNKQQNKEDK